MELIDAVVKVGFADSRPQAFFKIKLGKISVNKYVIKNPNAIVFCGDTVYLNGYGRIITGEMEDPFDGF